MRIGPLGRIVGKPDIGFKPTGELVTLTDSPLHGRLEWDGRVTLYGRRVMGTALYLRDHDFPRAYSTITA